MLRLAKPANFIAVTPSVQQRAKMRAPECVQLILEPRSEFHCHPVAVLDFQSLYPSIMIAYNYCFSTCLGRMQHLAKARYAASALCQDYIVICLRIFLFYICLLWSIIVYFGHFAGVTKYSFCVEISLFSFFCVRYCFILV